MITNEQDPEFVRWGHQLFDTDPYSNCAYYGIVTQDHVDYYQGDYTKEDHYGLESGNVDNDELLARALSQLAVTEAPGTPPTCSEQLQASFFSQNWHGQPFGCNYGSGQEEAEDILYSSSCSSPEEKSYYGEESSYALEMVDDSYDSEVGKRLNQMISIPGLMSQYNFVLRKVGGSEVPSKLKHVPKINGEIPSIDEATLDHQRLLERLQVYDLVEHKVQGDGNCQFRALSDQFYRTSEHHEFMRQEIVNQLKSFRETYEAYVPMAYDDYLEKMSRSGEWGDHVTLQAAADLYGVKIFVITSFKDTCYIEILPSDERSKRVIFLSFWAEVHYNSIYPEGDASAFKVKKKKKWRMFRNKHSTTTSEYS